MTDNFKNTVIYIVGPTASGKTALSIEVAKHLGGQIICGDSMQIYKNMPIATAAPTKDEKTNIPHRLFEFLEPDKSFSVSDYVKLAKEEIENVRQENSVPIVVGGTGLYISSLAENIDFGTDNDDGSCRTALMKRYEEQGAETLYKELSQIDPISAEKISANDIKRIVRALEVYYISGETMSKRIENSRKKGKLYDNIIIGVNYFDREKLYERINNRVDLMVKNGLLEEAKLASTVSGKTAAQAIGHKELEPYFKGELSLDEALERLKMQTRRYAKRQITWFSKTENLNWIYMDKTENPTSDALKIISNHFK